MMEERLLFGWGHKLLKALLFVLIVAGIFLLANLVISRIPPDLEKHRTQLDLLERAYETRRAELIRDTAQRVESAPNEVLAIQFQQELNISLSRLEQRYFADRQAILKSDYRVLEEYWSEVLEPPGEGGEDEVFLPPDP